MITWNFFPGPRGIEHEIRTPGVDWGPVRVRQVHREGAFSVWHIPGSTQWSGRGEVAYNATHFYVMRVFREPQAGVAGIVEQLRYFSKSDGKWREARRAAIAYAHALHIEEEQNDRNV